MPTYPTLETLMMGLAESSPYLWELSRADPERLVALLEAEPERRFSDIVVGTRHAVATAHDDAEVMRLLRRMKAEAALLIALADIGGVWPVMQVIDLQTMLADAAVGAAVDYLLADARRGGKLEQAARTESPRRGRATSCSRWARWGRASSTIQATSTSSSSMTPPLPCRERSLRNSTCDSRAGW